MRYEIYLFCNSTEVELELKQDAYDSKRQKNPRRTVRYHLKLFKIQI